MKAGEIWVQKKADPLFADCILTFKIQEIHRDEFTYDYFILPTIVSPSFLAGINWNAIEKNKFLAEHDRIAQTEEDFKERLKKRMEDEDR